MLKQISDFDSLTSCLTMASHIADCANNAAHHYLNHADAASSLRLLTETAAARQAGVAKYDDYGLYTEIDDDVDSMTSFFHQFYKMGSPAVFLQKTTFSQVEVNHLYDIFATSAERHWNPGRR